MMQNVQVNEHFFGFKSLPCVVELLEKENNLIRVTTEPETEGIKI